MNSIPAQEILSNTTPSTRPLAARYYPWIIMSLCALFLIYKYILQVSPSVMTAELMREFHMTGASLGHLAATYFYAYLVAQIIAGLLLDHYSPRLLTTAAIGCCGLSACFFAETHALWMAE